jgi:hypothetical protein
MSKPTHESSTPIDRLLQDRAQFVSWLTRLNSSTDSPAVPEAVRGRVRADYERRLTAVVEELRGHTSTLEGQVEGLSARRDELAVREREQQEQLSEAEIRHLVGEYDEGRWGGIRAELMKVILSVREELGNTTQEIDRLTDVLSTIRAPLVPPTPPPVVMPDPAPPPVAVAVMPELILPDPVLIVPEPVPPPPPPPPPPPAPELVRPAAAVPAAPTAPAAPVGGTEIPFRPVTPRPQPQPQAQPKVAPKKEEAASRTLWFPSGKPTDGGGDKLDELAFLKSVTGNEAPAVPASAPTPKPRASGGFTRQAEPVAPPPAPEPVVQKAAPPAATTQPAVAPVAEPKDRSSGGGQKTLKCGECGTLNRPTEWYCERCGAELAAL